MKSVIRKVAVTVAVVTAVASSGVTASAGERADIWPCQAGYTCLYTWPDGQEGSIDFRCESDGQNFFPFGQYGFSDWPESVRSQGNAAVLGNYSGSGNPYGWRSYDYNGGYVPAWSQINLERVWDAIIIKC